DLDDGALAVEVKLAVAVAAGYFKHASARVLNARHKDLGRAGSGRIAFEHELESAADTIEFHRARNTLCRPRVRSDEAGERAATAIDVRRIGLLVAREDTQIFLIPTVANSQIVAIGCSIVPLRTIDEQSIECIVH